MGTTFVLVDYQVGNGTLGVCGVLRAMFAHHAYANTISARRWVSEIFAFNKRSLHRPVLKHNDFLLKSVVIIRAQACIHRYIALVQVVAAAEWAMKQTHRVR
jgi:hypothetical protein